MRSGNVNDNTTLTDLAERVEVEELALGASPRDATLIARFVRCSDEYRDAWLAEREERLREGEEKREAADTEVCGCGVGCPECGGVPVHYYPEEEGT